MSRSKIALSTILFTLLAALGPVMLPSAALASNYYLDCSASSNGTGLFGTPWNALSSANSQTFLAGDVLLMKRGTTCSGELTPAGSGTASSPITVDAYGSGTRPILNAGSSFPEVVKLYNQSNWIIQNLVLQGGTTYGVNVQTMAGLSISGISLNNLTASGVTGTSTQRLFSGGEIYISTTNPASETISNVLINGVQVYGTKIAEGIFVSAGKFESKSAPKGSNIVIQNSLVYDVAADGLTVNNASNVTIAGNVVYNTGQCTACTGSTPNSLWTYNSTNVDVRNNETYGANTWSNDGGGLDIDYWSVNTTVEYNYSHDNAGYCVSVFGGENDSTDNSIIRYNVCANNNNRSSFPGQIPSDVWIFTFDGGTINGVQIYNNTSYWNPTLSNDPELQVAAVFSGTLPNLYENNIVYSTASEIENSITTGYSKLVVDYNLYYTTSGTLSWMYNGTTYTSLSSYKSGSGVETHSVSVDPVFSSPLYHAAGISPTAYALGGSSPAIDSGVNICAALTITCSPGTHDFIGNPVPQGSGFDIGAAEYSAGRVVFVDDNITGNGNNQFNYVGSWTHCTSGCDLATPTAFNATNSYTNTTNDYLTVAFIGSQVAVFGLVDGNGGLSGVSVDGGTEVSVDFYSSVRSGDQLIWTSPFLRYGSHTLRIRATGTRNPSSAGYYIVPDAVRITTGLTYKLQSILSGKDIDVTGPSLISGAGLVQWPDQNADHQLWTVAPLGDGIIATNQYSNLVMSDPGYSSSTGVQLQQLTSGGISATNQIWSLSPVPSLQFTYRARNSYSGLYIDVYGNTTASGANIDQYTGPGGPNQQWVFVPSN